MGYEFHLDQGRGKTSAIRPRVAARRESFTIPLCRVPNYLDARLGWSLSPTSAKTIGITRFWTIPSEVTSSTDILRLSMTRARFERSSRSSLSIRIFSKGLGPNEFIGFRVQRFYPRFFKLCTLMVGCSAGEAHLAATENLPVDIVAETLSNGIIAQARLLNAQLVVLKEFPARYRKVLRCFVQRGFARGPSMPMTVLDIGYDSFDAYMAKALRSSTRRKLRKKLAATAGVSDIRMSVTAMRQAWRRRNVLVAFSLCMVQGDALYAEYVGFDYTVALDLHLYHYVVRGMISWGISNGYRWVRSSGLIYDPKLHMRHRLDPVDLYVRHTSALANAIFSPALPWLVPVRYDTTLKLFPNYAEVW